MKDKIKQWFGNRQVRGFFTSVAILAVISVVFFLPDNFDGADLRQHDMVQGIANGQEITQYEAETGHKSWWTNSLFSGMPTFQISPKYSSNSLFGWFEKVFGLGLPAPSNLLFMMMVGFLIMCMAIGLRWEYGLLGAIAWGLSSYFVIIIGAGHIWKFVTLAYIPPTLGGVFLCYRGRAWAGGAMAAFFMMMQLSANHIQMTYYFAFVVLALAVAYGVKMRREIRKWLVASAVLLGAFALGIAANIPNLYHTAKYAAETQRAVSELAEEQGTAGVDRDYITKYSYGVAETATLLIPNAQGGATMKPVKGRMELKPLGELAAAKNLTNPNSRQIAGQLPQYFGEPESTNGPVYVGAIIFALFIVGCIVVKGAVKWALLAVTLLSIALAWGRNFMALTDLFIDIVPMYSKFRTPESILVIAEFTMPLLAVMGLWQIIGKSGSGVTDKRNLTALCVGFGVSAFICLITLLFPATDDQTSKSILEMSAQEPAYGPVYNDIVSLRHSMVRNDALRSLLFLALGFGVLWLWQKGKIKRGWIAVGVLAALTAVDLYTVDKRYVDHDSFVERPLYGSATNKIEPTQADRQILADKDLSYRVMDLDRLMQAEPSYFHKSIGGYHAAKLGRYQDLLERHILSLSTQTDFDVLNMLNTRYFVQNGQVIENPEAMGNAWFVDRARFVDGANAEMAGLQTVDLRTEAVADRKFQSILGDVKPHSPTDRITLTSYAPDRLTYDATTAGGATAVFSEVYFPWGWHAEIDGNPVEIARVNYILRAIPIPAGRHTVTMTFAPASVSTTTTVATIAVIAIYLWIICVVFGPALRLKLRKASTAKK